MLNSDSEVWGDDKEDGLHRLFAQGACVQDIGRALTALAENPVPPRTLTVLLMHHSPHYRWKEHFMLHELEPSSVAVLRDLLEQHGVSILLTGHIHDHALLVDLGERSEYEGLSCVEARCGTTTQRRPRRGMAHSRGWRLAVADLLHPRIAALFGPDWERSASKVEQDGPPPRPDNVLLIHRILYRAPVEEVKAEPKEEVFWTTELYYFDGANFRPAPEPDGVDNDPLHWRRGNGVAAPPQFKRCIRIWPTISAGCS